LQIVVNLLVNASKYTPTGGNIVVKLNRNDTECVLSVVDDGRGIAPKMRDAIFDMFVQEDASLDRTDSGMGVGLTLVRTLTESMGGQVEVASDGVGKGSCFTIYLPLTFGSPDVRQETSTPESAPPPVPPNAHVLIVEDNADAREMLSTLLRLDGYQVVVAEDGEQGLELILRSSPDVALIDIGLPKLDGYEIARRVTAQLGTDNKTLLIALTGYGQQADIDKALKAGFQKHLVKPIDAGSLASMLQATVTAQE